jgi:hypothetical protein
MKKIVPIIVAVIYVLSIVVVGFLGLKSYTNIEIIYCDGVTILDKDAEHPIITASDGSKNVMLIFADDVSHPTTFRIVYEVTPLNATDNRIRFVYDEESANKVSEDGIVEFYQPGGFRVQIVTQDGTNLKDTIYFYVIYGNGAQA